MGGIQRVPNSIRTYPEAALYLFKDKCGKDPTAEEAKAYAKQLREANPDRPHPAAADERWWPVIQQALEKNIIFPGPDPVCPKPPTPPPCKPCDEKGPFDPELFNPLDLVPEEPSVSGKKKKRLPVKVTLKTKNKIKEVVNKTEKDKLIKQLTDLRKKDLAKKLEKAINIAEGAKTEKEAREALKNLNGLIKSGEQIIKERLEGWEK